ncbi:serine/threonine protein kinase RIO2, putative [Entamoeba invadens IP1]|uniref:Serine/threonine-protein kinase RIO2 n=2 Tax=Entamoeba invadens TaxID=33085 RepID=A0A0A1UH59_ENTIV|nr:serine/threonine protein kinase RIO2, putative [Entamoeba invadens IP1]ELP94751.1 serine/threonine protein kinase RIO2, putative [Entamoeba invadens IP1]BAN41828.1 serine/threonine protein kinase RIO2, putative [Entamoeba invadens]|eukprot:XP_004261522.1 serine/threonine protein kinase RIO2, putative [Entamoeba invadens IP1]
MVKLDPLFFRYMSKSDFRVLTAIEMGMRNHELVPLELIVQLSKMTSSLVSRCMKDLHKNSLVWHTITPYNGYRLTYLGYDYLALRALSQRDIITAIGQKIGVGKEADIYTATNQKGEEVVLKFHRLGRTSFRQVKSKRDYTDKMTTNWLYLSKISAQKEYCFMKALYTKGMSVPVPIDYNRHCVVMSKINGTLLSRVNHLEEPMKVLETGIQLAIDLAEVGLVHCDLNEFNLILKDDETLVMIDFPQMISTTNPEASDLFARDVGCIKNFFWKKFGFSIEEAPRLDQIEKTGTLDLELKASGFDKKLEKVLQKARKKFVEENVNEKDLEDDDQDGEKDDDDDLEEKESEQDESDDDDVEQDDDEKREKLETN